MKKDGGAAFPRAYSQEECGGQVNAYDGQDGMSLRDYFAAKVVQGLCANNSVIGYSSQTGWGLVNCTTDVFCQIAYGFADSMIEAREKE